MVNAYMDDFPSIINVYEDGEFQWNDEEQFMRLKDNFPKLSEEEIIQKHITELLPYYQHGIEQLEYVSENSPIYRVIGVPDYETFIETMRQDSDAPLGISWTTHIDFPIEQISIDGKDHIWLVGETPIKCVDTMETLIRNIQFRGEENEITLHENCEITLKKICPILGTPKTYHLIEEEHCIPMNVQRKT